MPSHNHTINGHKNIMLYFTDIKARAVSRFSSHADCFLKKLLMVKKLLINYIPIFQQWPKLQ